MKDMSEFKLFVVDSHNVEEIKPGVDIPKLSSIIFEVFALASNEVMAIKAIENYGHSYPIEYLWHGKTIKAYADER